jgi:hypothetical protein
MRIFHHYEKWECWKYGMYGKKYNNVTEQCVLLFSSKENFKLACLAVIEKWKFSAEYFLTDMSINRRAWLGQAACSIWINCNENDAKAAWNKLSHAQQKQANQIAQQIINEFNQLHNQQLCLKFI